MEPEKPETRGVEAQPLDPGASEYGTIGPSETTPVTDPTSPLVDDESGRWTKGLFPYGLGYEIKELVKLAVPMIIIMLELMLMGPLALVYCGQLGVTALDGVSLANSLINISCISVANGLGTACDTFFAQTSTSKDKKKLGIQLQRSILTICLFILPVWAVHMNIALILAPLGQPKYVIDITAEYLLIFMPAGLCFYIYVCIAKYLQCQGYMLGLILCGLGGNILNAVLHYLLVYTAELGTTGSAIALMTSYSSQLLMLLTYLKVTKIYEATWGGWSWECLIGWWDFIKLAVCGLVMVCFEWWCLEAGIFLAAYMGVITLAIQTVAFTYEQYIYMIPFGIAIAASYRVGSYLGAGDVKAARGAGWATYIFSIVLASALLVIFASCIPYLPLAFTSNENVITGAIAILPVVAAFIFFDNTALTGAGILRGCGLQWIGTVSNAAIFGTALLVAIPVTLMTGALEVFWYAMVTAMILESLVFFLCIVTVNWHKLGEKARERATGYSAHAEDTPGKEADHGGGDGRSRQGLAPVEYGRSLLRSRVLIFSGFFAILLVGIIVRIITEVERDTPQLPMAANHSEHPAPLHQVIIWG